jgi:hypothetical protein
MTLPDRSPVMAREEDLPFFHSVYGLRLASNVAVPGLSVISNSDGIEDVRIRLKQDGFPLPASALGCEVFHVGRFKNSNGEPAFRAGFLGGGTHFEFSYCDGTRFIVDCHGHEIFADWPVRLTLEDISPYLVGPILGLVLRLHGVFPLHASAVAIGDQAIALMGPAGAGKSTTAGAFARCGYRVISDDVAALKQEGSRFVIPPGYPRVNVWADSVQTLFGANANLPLISPDWDKHFMPLDQETQFEIRSLPLGAIYVLQKREAGLTAPIVENVTGAEAFLAILGNTYMNYLPDLRMRRHEFEVIGRVLAQVPVRRVRPAADSSMLFDLCEAIVTETRALIPSPAL